MVGVGCVTRRAGPAAAPRSRAAAVTYPEGVMRAVGSLVADALAVLLFVAIGLLQHGIGLTGSSLGLVAWPFGVGMLVGHLAIRSWRAPFSIWPHGVFVWAITVVAAMAIRSLFGAGTEVSFIIVTAVVLGVFMLGWRAIARFVTRRERRTVLREGDLRADGGPTASPTAGAATDTDGASAARPAARSRS